MPFVERKDGKLVGVYANAQPGYAEEFVEEESAEVQAFRENILKPSAEGQPNDNA